MHGRGPLGGLEVLKELRRSGWPDVIEVWDSFANSSGWRIIPEDIEDIQVFRPGDDPFTMYRLNVVKIRTYSNESFHKLEFKMTFRVTEKSLVLSTDGKYMTNTDEVEVGNFSVKPFSDIGRGHDSYAWEEPELWSDESFYKMRYAGMMRGDDVPTTLIPLPDSPGARRRREIEEENRRIAAKKRAAANDALLRKANCKPTFNEDELKLECPCRSGDFIWCDGCAKYVTSPISTRVAYEAIERGVGYGTSKMRAGYLPWTSGYYDLSVNYSLSLYADGPKENAVKVKDAFGDLEIEVDLNRHEGLDTASKMFLQYYKATLDFTDIGDYVDLVMKKTSPDISWVPTYRCIDKRHGPHRDRHLSNKIKHAIEEGIPLDHIIVSEAYCRTLVNKCTVCAETTFDFKPDIPE